MTREKDTLDAIVASFCAGDDIPLAAIPDIELYMEQLLTFLNAKLEPFKRQGGDKLLTKTMINNYTKYQLLIPPHNKKYTKEHLLLLILIYQLKNVLDLGDVKRLFSPILRDLSTADDDVMPLAGIYAAFLDLKKEQFDDFHGGFAAKLAAIDAKTAAVDDEESRGIAKMFLIVLMLVAQANACKHLAERLIDAYFTPAADGKAPPDGEDYELGGQPV